MTRKEVYELIDGERNYQDTRWNVNTTQSQGLHSPTEFLTYMESYVRQGIEQVSRNADDVGFPLALDTIRKIAALAVACMEQHGAPSRKQ